MARIFHLLLFAGIQASLAVAEDSSTWQRLLDGMVSRVENSTEIAAPYPSWLSTRSTAIEEPSPIENIHHISIERFLDYLKGPGLRWYQSSIRRLQPIQPSILRVLGEEGVPSELIWVGLVESGFNPVARSPKDALGVWQLMPDTARQFGLRVGVGDERVDLERSTRAAARYLRRLHAKFDDWPLALAAYNAGEKRVEKALDQRLARDFWTLYDSQSLPRETMDYVPAILAAQKLAQADPNEFSTEPNQGQRSSGRIHIEYARVVFAP